VERADASVAAALARTSREPWVEMPVAAALGAILPAGADRQTSDVRTRPRERRHPHRDVGVAPEQFVDLVADHELQPERRVQPADVGHGEILK
jgi:hypothetical protein